LLSFSNIFFVFFGIYIFRHCLCFTLKHIVFQKLETFDVERNKENGGPKSFKSYEEVVQDFESGTLHPGDLKSSLVKAIDKIIEPVRAHFKTDPHAKQLLEKVQMYMQEVYGTEETK